MRAFAAVIVGAVLVTSATGQEPGALAATAQRLRDERSRPAAMHDLEQAGPAGANAVLDAFVTAAATGDAARETFAAALGELDTSTAAIVDRLLEIMPQHAEPLRSHLLRALGNGALLADADARASIRAATRQWANAGLLYSPAEDRPTFAWYRDEYVRILRRLSVSAGGDGGQALRDAMQRLRNERGNGVFLFAQAPPQPQGDDPHCAIESFGAHGQREQLEAIAELAVTCPDEIDDVLDELTSYLRYSPPRPPRIRIEHCAGIGENAPNALPGVEWPTKWRYDAWHFACARAVFERHQNADARLLALRHLLHASNTSTRLRAIEAVRQWPKPRLAFADDLDRCLVCGDRNVVREAIVTMMQSPTTLATARPRLLKLVNSDDRELAALARRALK